MYTDSRLSTRHGHQHADIFTNRHMAVLPEKQKDTQIDRDIDVRMARF